MAPDFKLGSWLVFTRQNRIQANGKIVRVEPKTMEVLVCLAEHDTEVVSKQELLQTVWRETFVTDDVLTRSVSELRKALGDHSRQPQYIETIPKRGYRLVVRASPLELADDVTPSPGPKPGKVTEKQEQRSWWTGVELSRAAWILAPVISVAALLLGPWRALHPGPSLRREPKFTELTVNSAENPVTSSAISPDGKYLAFTDNAMKIRIRVIETGETRTVPDPESLKDVPVEWTIAAWFPDSTRFIVNARSTGSFSYSSNRSRLFPHTRPNPLASPGTGIWIVSLLGKAPQKLHDGGFAFSVSPDGSAIALGDKPGQFGNREVWLQFGNREVWLMDAEGMQARKLYEAPENGAVGGPAWSRDGQRVVYFEASDSDGQLVSREIHGESAIPLVRFSDWRYMVDYVWLPDGRLIFARRISPEGHFANLWELSIDSHTGKPVGQPRQLTNWSDAGIGEMSVISDGTRLAFQRSSYQTTVNVAELQAQGTRISLPRRLTLNEYVNAAETWTLDSRALVFRSRRNGHVKVFLQAIDSDTEEPLVMGADDVASTAMSPDGSWLYYLDCRAEPVACEAVVPLMAIPAGGGQPHEVLKSNTYGRPRCSVAPTNLCAIAEQASDGEPLIFTSFDAVKGRGAEIARFETKPGADYAWGLSRDGTQIAILKNEDDRIHIVSLKGRRQRVVNVKGWARIAGVYWAADGKGWFTIGKNKGGIVLLYVDWKGEAHPLWEMKGDPLAYGMPSPDGRYLAIVATTQKNNIWVMENY